MFIGPMLEWEVSNGSLVRINLVDSLFPPQEFQKDYLKLRLRTFEWSEHTIKYKNLPHIIVNEDNLEKCQEMV